MDINGFATGEHLIWNLLIALLLGAIIGTQRGWVMRNSVEGSRVAGIRTFSLVGLLGGLVAILADLYSPLLLGFALIALVILACIAFIMQQKKSRDISITGVVSLLVTFVLGSLAVSGEAVLAASAAVITAVVLDNKRELHQALQKLQEYELDAALRLLIISIVLLPLLPNQSYGPWNALNPYEIWWMVVLIASISFVGYFAIKIGGAKRGILFTSIFAGLSSSTALTLQFSHLSREQANISPLLASGILLSCGTMFPRLLIILFVINPQLVSLLWPIVMAMMAALYLPAWWIWRRSEVEQIEQSNKQSNPLALQSALFFGMMLAVIMLLSHALAEWFGNAGVLILSAFSGITDVDAISLALGRQSIQILSVTTAALGILIAASVNTIVKMSMVVAIGDKKLWLRVAPVMVGCVAVGALMFFVLY
ncbi:MgtC/SapB family protein [Vibrio parahaemolyticus]|uniref:MgtC/SapB family protein n=1 Tax=Vibrio parahaemolyticus TaxID=670 RepID=UPI001A273B5A|nr:MgtC/SapB family protein [Vibrio parahaemolyticus]MBO0177887.1 MgtC/SapB family protein [Vibrio parahaemolyticus]MCI9700196.1 MgtC/SapB family protein [Vibrio parahaemolyticus]MCR9814449.1 MgtC/SapB family protein [Vibrio parahaemolyticus]MCR9818952.1 MgtC/SapB family protein [Vibrio parahaemolyticus]MDF4287705.1 MgtC/SapB family protein [Vibrio parahaemolyticus]